jgi:hypothetical protein
MIINIVTSKSLVFGKSESIRNNFSEILKNASVGIPQLIGNFMAMLIVGTSRLFIDNFM